LGTLHTWCTDILAGKTYLTDTINPKKEGRKEGKNGRGGEREREREREREGGAGGGDRSRVPKELHLKLTSGLYKHSLTHVHTPTHVNMHT
jgi:hypothetical protein